MSGYRVVVQGDSLVTPSNVCSGRIRVPPPTHLSGKHVTMIALASHPHSPACWEMHPSQDFRPFLNESSGGCLSSGHPIRHFWRLGQEGQNVTPPQRPVQAHRRGLFLLVLRYHSQLFDALHGLFLTFFVELVEVVINLFKPRLLNFLQ